MECYNLPGFAIAAVRGEEAHIKGYGKMDIKNDIDVTGDSIFMIGSLTKAMTASLLAKVLPEKHMSSTWDTKVKDILGDSFKLSTEDLTNGVTIRDLLSHKTGLAAGIYGIFRGYSKNITAARMVKKLRHLPSVKPLRLRFDYNQWTYMLASHVTEVLAGGTESWEELMKRHLFEPLGMDSTVIGPNLSKLAANNKLALPYQFSNGKHEQMPLEIFDIHPAQAAGAAFSSANDMAEWIKFLLRTPKQIVNDTVFSQTMLSTQHLNSVKGQMRPTFPVDMYDYGYGLGWFTSAYRGRKLVQHWGELFAYTATLWLFPNSDVGIFVSTNGKIEGGGIPRELIVAFMADMMLGENPWLNTKTACVYPKPWISKPPKDLPHGTFPELGSQRNLSEYVGVYGHRLLGDVKVFINESTKKLQLTLGERVRAVLYPTAEKDVFRWELQAPLAFMNVEYPNYDSVHFMETKGKGMDSLVSTAMEKQFVFKTDVRFADASSATAMSRGVVWTKVAFVLIVDMLIFVYSCTW
ncbi:uncharacterized protein LOC135464140 [Liolophura sinensis]|uniref:uncharacterized protein LOC135464140 n=1 Tax=Liolophura sinensis TaxID=3198878 RepID=UPI0031590ECA